MPEKSGTALTLTVHPFTDETFSKAIKHACGLYEDPLPPQAEYIRTFLSNEELGAKSLVIEHPYTDRHYTEEYRSYYSTTFRAPPQQVSRLHFFQDKFDQQTFEDWIAEAAESDVKYKAISELLNNGYLGFVVIRPLPSAPIGRTILKPYAKVTSRWYIQPAHRAHLAGIELKVHGVPFQQQEVAVGACASTAIWVALAAAARASGQRSPTPNQITEAATRHVLTNRAMPADGGLDLAQVLESIRANGYEPYLMKPKGAFSEFSLSLKCYLRSNIPAVVLLDTRPDYHAITLVGYRVSDDGHESPPLEIACKTSVLRSIGLTRLYAHEDRLGPYARMKWLSPEEHSKHAGTPNDLPALLHEPYKYDRYDYPPTPMGVYAAIIPLNSKLRLSAPELISIASELRAMIRHWLGPIADNGLFIDLKFSLSGEYIKEILTIGIKTPQRAQKIATSLNFPRYVGIIRYFLNDFAVCDVICDTSDIMRIKPAYGAILALISFNDEYVVTLRDLIKTIIPGALVM